MKLTYHLFTPEAAVFEDLMNPSVLQQGDYEEVTRPDPEVEFEYKIYLEKNKTKAPSWGNFLRSYVQDSALEEARNATNSFVVLIKSPQGDNGVRYLAVTGGHGAHALNKDLLESQFGLMTTLNAINPDEIKYFDVGGVDARATQRRISSKVASNSDEFDIDFDHDLVRSVSGYSSDGIASLSGSSSLGVSSKTNFRQLGERCQYFVERFLSQDYAKHFSQVNRIVPQRNKRMIALLDEVLIKALNDRSDSVGVVTPHKMDDDRFVRYTLSGLGHTAQNPYIDRETVYSFLDSAGDIHPDDLKQEVRIQASDGAADPTTARTASSPLYGFLTTTIDYQGSRYILAQRMWYRVAPGYEEQLDEMLKEVVTAKSSALKPWNISMPRAEYLYGYANSDEYVVFKPGSNGRSYGDLFHVPTSTMYFLNPLSRSSTQGDFLARSTRLIDAMKTSPQAQERILRDMQDRSGGALGEHDLSKTLRVAYGFATPESGDTSDILPLLVKRNLIKHGRTLRKLGVQSVLEIIAA